MENEYIDLIKDIFNEGYRKIVYLCADIHNYQAINVSDKNNFNLPLIVIGTGGAKLDFLSNLKTNYGYKYERPYFDAGKYELFLEDDKDYGLC